MKLPQPKSNGYKIAHFIYRSGGATKVQAVEYFSKMEPQTVRDAFNYMLNQGMLSRSEDTYRVRPHVSSFFDMCEPTLGAVERIAAPADASLNNKPWSGRYSFANAPRREEIRKDVSFINGSIGFSAGYRL